MATILTAGTATATNTAGVAFLLSAADADRKALFLNPNGNMRIGNSDVTTATGFPLLANTIFSLGGLQPFNSGGMFTGDLYAAATATSTCFTLVLK